MNENNNEKCNNAACSNNPVYSYHTFLFPFTWRGNGLTSHNEYSEIKSMFKNVSSWESTEVYDDGMTIKKDDKDYGKKLEFYKEYQYFFPYVRKAVFNAPDNCNDDICEEYQLKDVNDWKYIITKTEETTNITKRYELTIQSIKVKIVNTGVGLFIMECENCNHTDIESVKNINDLGRRITLPFIHDKKNICADQLEVHTNGESFVEDFNKFRLEKEEINLSHLACFITEIMNFGKDKGSRKFVSTETSDKKDVQILPILDDRMYVAFAVNTKSTITSKSLYELAYVDSSGNCTCQNEAMRTELLEKVQYKRWLSYGTLYTISNIGFGMLSTSETNGEDSYLYENFLVCYLPMVSLILIQRASIIKFNRDTANIAQHFSSNNRRLSRGNIRKIMNLQEKHVAFDSQLLFSEVTSEQQGTEMYDMLKNAFKIHEEDEKLDERLTSLYEITDTNLNIAVNASVGVLTWVSIILSVGAMVYNILFASDVIIADSDYRVTWGSVWTIDVSVWVFLIIITCLSLAAWAIVSFHNRRR